MEEPATNQGQGFGETRGPCRLVSIIEVIKAANLLFVYISILDHFSWLPDKLKLLYLIFIVDIFSSFRVMYKYMWQLIKISQAVTKFWSV